MRELIILNIIINLCCIIRIRDIPTLKRMILFNYRDGRLSLKKSRGTWGDSRPSLRIKLCLNDRGAHCNDLTVFAEVSIRDHQEGYD